MEASTKFCRPDGRSCIPRVARNARMMMNAITHHAVSMVFVILRGPTFQRTSAGTTISGLGPCAKTKPNARETPIRTSTPRMRASFKSVLLRFPGSESPHERHQHAGATVEGYSESEENANQRKRGLESRLGIGPVADPDPEDEGGCEEPTDSQQVSSRGDPAAQASTLRSPGSRPCAS